MTGGRTRRSRTGVTYRARGASAVNVRVQLHAGRDANPVRDLKLRLSNGHELIALNSGAFTVPVPAQNFETATLMTGDATLGSWMIGARAALPAPDTTAGLCARLNQLGYNAGIESDEGSADLERAALRFEADHGIYPDGITGNIREDSILSGRQVSVTVRERLANGVRDELLADVGGDDPPAESGNAARGVVGGGNVMCNAYGGSLRLVLVRFDRTPGDEVEHFSVPGVPGTVSGPPIDRPYVDDRGSREEDGHRGPWISVIADSTDRTYQVDLIREAISTDAPVYLESAQPAYVSVPSGPLPGGAPRETIRLTVRPAAATNLTGNRWSQVCDISVRLGSSTGPVAHVLRVLVLRRVNLRLGIIQVRHISGGHELTPREIRATVGAANRVFEQAGVVLDISAPENSPHYPSGVMLDFVGDELDFHYDQAAPAPPAGLTGEDLADWQREHDPNIRMLELVHHPDRLNIYVFDNHAALLEMRDVAAGGSAQGVLAYGFWKEIFHSLYPDHPTMCFMLCSLDFFKREQRSPAAFAHEICHVLGMRHPDDSRYRRVTHWALRRLMFYHRNIPNLPSWHPFHGKREPGTALTIKDIARNRDGEVHRIRTAAGRGAAYDGRRTESRDHRR